MATTAELKEKLKMLAKQLPVILQDAATAAALDAKALVYRRIISRGFGARYSENFIPAYWLEGKEVNRSGATYLKKNRKKGVNWKGFRQAQGLQTRFVDLSYTGFMWKELGVVRIVKESEYRYTAYLGGTTPNAQLEFDYNFANYGDFFRNSLTKRDLAFVQKNSVNKILSGIKNIGL